MQIRIENGACGITAADQRDPITGERILLIQETNEAGEPTGLSVILPVDEKVIAHLHRQTSPIVVTDDGEARRLLDEALPASPELELEQKRRSRRLGRRA